MRPPSPLEFSVLSARRPRPGRGALWLAFAACVGMGLAFIVIAMGGGR